jgi:hypothetical protein
VSKWNDVIYLLSAPNAYQDSEGGQHEGERVARRVFCNVGTMGLMTMAEMRSSEVRITSGENIPNVGMHAMHVVWIRQIDYQGEDQCIFNDKEMDIIALTSEGENYKMIIRERIGNDEIDAEAYDGGFFD